MGKICILCFIIANTYYEKQIFLSLFSGFNVLVYSTNELFRQTDALKKLEIAVQYQIFVEARGEKDSKIDTLLIEKSEVSTTYSLCH